MQTITEALPSMEGLLGQHVRLKAVKKVGCGQQRKGVLSEVA